MGAPKQKWTAEEEAALKAGVIKHGAGKWRTILTDPEYSAVLRMRSNVDLKVSNFNTLAVCGKSHITTTALVEWPSVYLIITNNAEFFIKSCQIIWYSKVYLHITMYYLNCEQDKWRNINVTAIWGSRQKAKLAKNLPAPKLVNNHTALSTIVQHEDDANTKPLAVSGGTTPNSKEQISRLWNFKLNISSI